MTYSKQECIEQLQSLHDELGRPPKVKDYKEHNCSPSVKTLSNKFGSWNDAKRKAGLEVTEHGKNKNTKAAIRHMRKIAPTMETTRRGYEKVRVETNGVRKSLYVHRLIAVSEYGFNAVSSVDDVHHKNEIPWDNRPENLEPLTKSKHLERHR